jgi:hypothetical protein
LQLDDIDFRRGRSGTVQIEAIGQVSRRRRIAETGADRQKNQRPTPAFAPDLLFRRAIWRIEMDHRHARRQVSQAGQRLYFPPVLFAAHLIFRPPYFP